MVRIIDFQATAPVQRVNQIRPIRIPHSRRNLELATLPVTIPRRDSFRNQVQLTATVGIRGLSDTSQILFRIFRDGREIFRAQQGIEAELSSEQNYLVTLQAVDMDLRQGSHLYQVTAENLTFGAEAAVVGPISFSVIVVEPSDTRDRDRDSDRDRDRHRTRSSSRDRRRSSSSSSSESYDRDRYRDRDRRSSRDRDRESSRNRRRSSWDYDIPE